MTLFPAVFAALPNCDSESLISLTVDLTVLPSLSILLVENSLNALLTSCIPLTTLFVNTVIPVNTLLLCSSIFVKICFACSSIGTKLFDLYVFSYVF